MLQNLLDNLPYKDLFVYGIIVLVILVLFVIIYRILVYFVKKSSRDKKIIETVKSVRLLMFMFAFASSLLIPLSIISAQQEIVGIIRIALTMILIISIAWAVIRIVKYSIKKYLGNLNLGSKDNYSARKKFTQFKIFENIIIVVIIIVAIALGLLSIDGIKDIGLSILGSAGVLGLIVGFSAQKLIASIIAGFQIAMTQPIRLDDVVIIENEWGWIEEINLTYVVVRIWDKRRLVVPTTFFIDKPFQNWTRKTAELLGTVFIYTDYTVPVDEVRRELTRLLEQNQKWDGKVNVLQVTNATETTLELRALMSAADSPAMWDLRVDIREQLIGFIQKNYPQCLPRTRVNLAENNVNPGLKNKNRNNKKV